MKFIKDYDELDTLFFEVLAVKVEQRDRERLKRFLHVPYLNSSLFEPTDLEHDTLFISNLADNRSLPIISGTVLKGEKGKKRSGELSALEYLFAFLDAYDFSSEGGEDIQEDNKTLINASVLGLIFEKINGYKDGSFFTPGFITMYMCRETIRRAVVQKFNEEKGWICESLDDVYDKIEDRSEANDIINSLKICDPAVGSGHFLVSALNEILSIKHDLRVLQDRDGRRLKEYELVVENDELIVTDEEGALFEYHPESKESQRVQETLFHEKQTIIENCLFGVDINPNSVKICRLRLWIELLKHAYYKSGSTEEVIPQRMQGSGANTDLKTTDQVRGDDVNKNGKGRHLETLPNIDINIKTGNSLISRFALDADLKEALKKSKWSIDSYRAAVQSYRNARNKDEKREMIRLIDDIKGDFRTEILRTDKNVVKLKKLSDELVVHTTQTSMFDQTAKEKKEWKKTTEKLTKAIANLETEIEEIKNNKIFENAFEWRFEFPEVLNEQGDFVGFDMVIGNPPYIRQEEFKEIKPYLQTNYATYAGTADMYVYLPVFEEATTYPCILEVEKTKSDAQFKALNVETLEFPEGLNRFVKQHSMEVLSGELPEQGWTLTSAKEQRLLAKLKSKGTPLGEYVDGKIYRGVLTGYNKAFVIDEETKNRLITEDPNCAEIIKPFLAGRDIKRYQQPVANNYLIFTRRGIDMEKYPSVLNYLKGFKTQLEPRPKHIPSNKWPGRKPGSYMWYEIQDAVDYYEEFEKPKIFIPAIIKHASYTFDNSGKYGNDKTSIIPTNDLCLLGILNSCLMNYVMTKISSTKQNGYYEYKPVYVSQLHILEAGNYRKDLESKVTEILSLKKENPQADTSALEAEIDAMVYELYGLSEEEIAIVEGSVG